MSNPTKVKRMKNKFSTATCAGCGESIEVGAPIDWTPQRPQTPRGQRAKHPDCAWPPYTPAPRVPMNPPYKHLCPDTDAILAYPPCVWWPASVWQPLAEKLLSVKPALEEMSMGELELVVAGLVALQGPSQGKKLRCRPTLVPKPACWVCLPQSILAEYTEGEKL